MSNYRIALNHICDAICMTGRISIFINSAEKGNTVDRQRAIDNLKLMKNCLDKAMNQLEITKIERCIHHER